MKDFYSLIMNMCLKSEKAEELQKDLDEMRSCLDEAVENFRIWYKQVVAKNTLNTIVL